MPNARRASSPVPLWIPKTLVAGSALVVGLSVTFSILRPRGDAAAPDPVVDASAVAAPAPSISAVDEIQLPALPVAGNIRQAADHTRIRQLIAQYREAVVTGSQTRARVAAEILVREGGYATPYVDRAIAESGNARVREELTRLRARLPEPVVVTGPTQGPPPP